MNQQMYPRSSWAFNETVAEQFEQHVRQSVPFYERVQQMIVSLSDYFVEDQGVIYDLGCSTGETIQLLHKRHAHKGLRYIGLDASVDMLEIAKNKSREIGKAEFHAVRLEEYAYSLPSTFIISMLTLHFLPIDARKSVLQNIYETLKEGGCLVLVEKTNSRLPAVQHMLTQLYYEDKINAGFTHEEVFRKEQSLRGVLTPVSMETNLLMLQSLGFETEIFFKDWLFTGYIAMKPIQIQRQPQL